jgi:hypothetical protein
VADATCGNVKGAILQLIIFHLKDDENHQLSIMDFTITN